MRKKWVVLSALIIMMVAIVGCQSNTGGGSGSGSGATTGSGSGSGGGSAPAAASPSADEKVTIRFSWWGNEVRHNATVEAIELYMERNPHVEIKAEFRGTSEREQIATALAGGTVADIVQLNPPWMEDFTRNSDFFVDLSTKTDLIDLSGFDQGFLNAYGIWNDKLVGLPTGVNATMTIINKDAAERFGIPTSLDTKWTWEDFYNVGKTVNEQDPEAYMLNQDVGGMVEFILKKYIIQKTGKFLIDDDYNLGFTRDDLVEALTYINQLYMDKVAIPASETNVFNDAAQTNPRWINGQAVAAMTWTSTVYPYTDGIDAEFAPFIYPVHEDALDTSLVVKPPQLIAVSNTSQHVDEAVKFLDFFFNDLDAAQILKDVRSVPAVKEAADLIAELDLVDPLVKGGLDYGLENMGLNENGPSTNGEIIQVLENAVEIVSYPDADIEKVVDDSLYLIEDILNSLKAQ